MSDHAGMDQGLAAIIAAGFGLVGAAAGGAAAVWGAKVGAEKTAAASRQQAAAQAAFERDHWLRQQRLELFGRLLAKIREWEGFALRAEDAFESPEKREDWKREIGGVPALFEQIAIIIDELWVICPHMSTHGEAYDKLRDAASKYLKWAEDLPPLESAPTDPEAAAQADPVYQDAKNLQRQARIAVGAFIDQASAVVTGVRLMPPTPNRHDAQT
ncbi:hypothetical protein [Streptomyces africanus]|uniref:hypothetical protein n=1 Tax=Streptomyces africanus TaxID=231024 RepID=UPI00117C5271|nr:hypothetical protein [Streptomyces africanus]